MRVLFSFWLPLCLIVGVALQPGASNAQLLTSEDGEQPVTVEADNEIEWVRDQKLYIARGKSHPGRRYRKGDVLTATYRDKVAAPKSIDWKRTAVWS